MMKKLKLILIIGTALALGMTSCKKGDTGPAGPVGPAGPDSVVYSSWQTMTFTYIAADTILVDTISAPSITQSILDSGVILTYFNLPDPNNTSVSIIYSGDNVDTYGITENFTLGSINLQSLYYDLSGEKMRYVTIPGSKLEGTNSVRTYNGYTIAELKAMPYSKAVQIVGGSSN